MPPKNPAQHEKQTRTVGFEGLPSKVLPRRRRGSGSLGNLPLRSLNAIFAPPSRQQTSWQVRHRISAHEFPTRATHLTLFMLVSVDERGRRRLSGEQMLARDKRIAQLRQAGWSQRAIAARFGVAVSVVQLALRRSVEGRPALRDRAGRKRRRPSEEW